MEDNRVGTKFILAGLWTSVMFCYLYADFFQLFVPGRLEDLIRGESGVGPTTPVILLLFAILMSVPALLIFLSLALPAKANRRLNLATGVFYTLVMLLVVSTSIDRWMLFYLYFGVIEIILTILIIRYAWRWPRAGS